jgi:NodT family efflux transporter outer membrane factor (OMF) lipoprotein
MSDLPHRSQLSRLGLAPCMLALALALAGCTVGPDFVEPKVDAPTDWRGEQEALRVPIAEGALQAQWWRVFHDPLLDDLQARAAAASPDLRTAALHVAQARAQRISTVADSSPEVGMSGGVTRQRQSERSAGTRVIDVVGSGRPGLAEALAQPYTLYQVGFDASWELDLWGRVRRAIESVDAELDNQAALYDLARLSLASDVARNYLELRTTQRQVGLLQEDIAALQERLQILQARVQGGVVDELDLQRQHADLSTLEAQLPPLQAQQQASANQLSLLLGERPGALGALLRASVDEAHSALPDLALGLPSEVARRRPDIRAAEARLHQATASIGVASADLYPSIRLGGSLGYESYLSGQFSDWGSRTWSIGPSLDLPLFDRGRRKSVVRLRELQQQEAAVSYQQTVLKAWQEIDDALSAYTAEQQQAQRLLVRQHSSDEAYKLALAQYQGGTVDFTTVLDSQRSYLQARRELVESQGRLNTRYVTINKVLGNVPGRDPEY